MVSESGLAGGPEFEPPLYKLFPICCLKVHGGLYFVYLTLHVRV